LKKPEGTLAALHCLICRVGGRVCALPLEHVREVMRPCRTERVLPAPRYLLGVALIRGQTVPVVDAAVLLTGDRDDVVTRFVLLRLEERRVALAVAEVIGTRVLDRDELAGLPPLLAERAELIEHVTVLDGKLVEVLASARLIEAAAECVASRVAAS
jgi:purine-binding chemotaxis protein CheW